MAIGDVKSYLASIDASLFLEIQPPEGEEWVIHNIYHEGDVSLIFYDGTNSITFASASGSGSFAMFVFHLTNSIRLRVKNTMGATKLIGYDGVQTK